VLHFVQLRLQRMRGFHLIVVGEVEVVHFASGLRSRTALGDEELLTLPVIRSGPTWICWRR